VAVCILHVYAADSKNKKGKGELLQAPWLGGVGETREETCSLTEGDSFEAMKEEQSIEVVHLK